MKPRVTEVAFTMASPALQPTGLLGWARFTLDGRYRLDGIAVRKTSSGRLTLSFPTRRDASGREHCFIRTLRVEDRREIERQVIDPLSRDARLIA